MDDIDEKVSHYDEHRTRIAEGRYLLFCVRWEKKTFRFKGKFVLKIVLWFEVRGDCDDRGKIVPMFLEISEDGKVRPRSDYAKFWIIANECQPPERYRLKEMPPSKFWGKYFDAYVKDVKPEWETGEEQPEVFHYSRVKILYQAIIL